MQVSDEAREAAAGFVSNVPRVIQLMFHGPALVALFEAFQSAIDAARADERAKALREAAQEARFRILTIPHLTDMERVRNMTCAEISDVILKLENPNVE